MSDAAACLSQIFDPQPEPTAEEFQRAADGARAEAAEHRAAGREHEARVADEVAAIMLDELD